MKILIGTKNPGKIEGAKQAFEKYFDKVEIEGIPVDSNVGDQPINEEILQGAKNRVKNLKEYASKNNIKADFYISSEAGITDSLGEWIDINAVVVEDSKGFQSIGTSQGFPIPDKYIDEIKATELGKVMDKIFDGQELGKGKGGISYLTKNEVSRIDLTRNAFIMALTKHYNEDKKLRENDVKELIKKVNELKSISEDIYVCGTSIFRTLNKEERAIFLNRFKNETGYDFNIISQERENKLTVLGATRFVKDKVCVFIGGGGSTEIAIYDKEIKESVNTNIGVIDVMQEFPDLAENYATTDLEKVETFIKGRLNLPKQKADILILAGGGHEKFARNSGIKYEENTLYKDNSEPIMMDIETRRKETERYYKSISLDEIRQRVKDPDWWYATRAMSAFALVVAEAIDAKYIVPTDIAMAYGIIKDGDNKK